MLSNTPNQPSKFRPKIWFIINDESRGTYSNNSQFKFETSMLNLILCDFSEIYVLVKGTIAILNTTAIAAATNNTN